MKTVKTYEGFNQRRYSNPWIAEVKNGKADFTNKIGGYTGRYNGGEAGELYVAAPVDGKLYVYGQKDYRGSNTSVEYCLYTDNSFQPIAKTEISKYSN